MIPSIGIWIILLMIGVFDAREHRIPNMLVVCVLLFSIFEVFTTYPLSTSFELLKGSSVGFLICFAFSFIIYCFGGMAAGDVKLIAAIGFIVGTGSLVSYLQHTSWVCILIGVMYWMLNGLTAVGRPKIYIRYYLLQLILGTHSSRKISSGIVEEKTYMPFAPILIIGLAMHQFSLH